MTTKAIPHGTLSGAKYHHCTCPDCRNADNTYDRTVYRLKAYGRWQPLTDAEPARQHIRNLQHAGIGLKRIAEHAGVSYSAIEGIIYGRPDANRRPVRRIRHETEAKILAVRPTPALLPPGANVDATGTRRRLQALAVRGWPGTALAARLGWKKPYVHQVLANRYVFLRTHQAVADLYQELRDADPVEHGVSPVSAKRARLAALRKGWAGPEAWDADIDDPAADPAAQERRPRRDHGPDALTKDEQQRIAQRMTAAGVSPREIAERVGVTERTINRWRSARGWKAAA